jgi:UDP-glucose 4-epimerase
MGQAHPLKIRSRPTLVVGGAGFIGARVVEALLAAGAEVRVFDDLSSGRATSLPLHDPNLELRIGDMHEPATLDEAMRGMKACVHLAAARVPRRALRDPYETALSNILGFINVLDAARRHHVERLVYASSAAVYGDAPDVPLAENTPARPISPLGMEKLVAEGYAELYARQYRLRALGLRYFSVYGLRDAADDDGVIGRMLARVADRRPALVHGDGAQTRDFVHVEDAARATVAALSSNEVGICNVASGERVEVAQLAQMVGEALGRRPMVHRTAARANEIVHSWADTRRLRESLGFTPDRRLAAGLGELAADWEARQRLRERPAVPLRPELLQRHPEPRAPRRF